MAQFAWKLGIEADKGIKRLMKTIRNPIKGKIGCQNPTQEENDREESCQTGRIKTEKTP